MFDLLMSLMGGIDGFETCRPYSSLNPRYKDVPCHFVTALSRRISRGFEVGGTNYNPVRLFVLKEVRSKFSKIRKVQVDPMIKERYGSIGRKSKRAYF